MPKPIRSPIALLESMLDRSERDEATGCLVWLGAKANGYGRVGWGGRGKLHQAHRMIWEMAKGPIPDGLHLCHRCDNPACIEIDHMFCGDRSANMQDCVSKGRNRHGALPTVWGADVWTSKLTETDVKTARHLHRHGEGITALAGRFGVARRTMRDAVNGKTWKHID